MKRFFLILIASCFVFAGNFDNFAQTRKIAKKSINRKLVRCYENGKRVYRNKCRTVSKSSPKIKPVTTVKKVKSNRQTPDSLILSDGVGSGGGLGTGRGQGSGGGGGNGDGNGNGGGLGVGNGTEPDLPEPTKIKTSDVRILSKPRANYTDAARQNQVQGTVKLKITFLATGQIGAIFVVKGLPNGLSEQAVIAAKGIRFEPAKKNGVPYSVPKIISYSFTIY
jgi:TonB family protein